MFVSSDVTVLDIHESEEATKYKDECEKSQVFMKLCFQNCNKQPRTSHHAQENLNALKMQALKSVSKQSALESVKQAKVLPTISVNEVGGSLHFPETLNSATDRLNFDTFSKTSLPERCKGQAQAPGHTAPGSVTLSVQSPGTHHPALAGGLSTH